MKRITLALMLALCCLASASKQADAQAKAAITGPTESPPGDLVVLDPSGSNGQVFKWQSLDLIEGKFLIFENKLVFASGLRKGEKSKTFQFVLSVGDVTDNVQTIDSAIHRVTIGTPEPDDDDSDDEDDDPPEPVEPGDFQSLTKLIPQLAANVQGDSRAEEAALIAQTFDTFSAKASDYSSIADFTMATSDAYKAAIGYSAYQSWSNAVFSPLADELRKLRDAGKLSKVEQYGPAWKAIAQGFKEVK